MAQSNCDMCANYEYDEDEEYLDDYEEPAAPARRAPARRRAPEPALGTQRLLRLRALQRGKPRAHPQWRYADNMVNKKEHLPMFLFCYSLLLGYGVFSSVRPAR